METWLARFPADRLMTSMRASVCRTLALVGLTTTVIATAADWPQFRGPGGAATSADKGTPVTWSSTEGLAWKTELPGAGASSPIVVGKHIFLTAYTGFAVLEARVLPRLWGR